MMHKGRNRMRCNVTFRHFLLQNSTEEYMHSNVFINSKRIIKLKFLCNIAVLNYGVSIGQFIFSLSKIYIFYFDIEHFIRIAFETNDYN